MNNINIPILGSIKCTTPDLVTCYDLLSEWGSDPSRALIGRLCSAAIGLSTASNITGLPVYKITDLDLINYGYHCMSRLLKMGIPASAIVAVGMDLVQAMAASLPQEKEVADTVNFTEADQLEDLKD